MAKKIKSNLLTKDLSAKYVLAPWQVVAIFLLIVGWAYGFFNYYNHTLYYSVLIFNILFFYTLTYRQALILLGAKIYERDLQVKFSSKIADKDLPKYTIMIPLFHEAAVIPHLFKAIDNLDYPKNKIQVLLLLEEEDKETPAAIDAFGLPAHFEKLIVPQGKVKTKANASNYGLSKATGDLICIYDAEDIPEKLQLRKVAQKFKESDDAIVCVQCRLSFYNGKENLLTNMFEMEYQTLYNFILPVATKFGLPIPLGGSSNHFKTAILRELGGWDPYNVTEDCDLGLRLAASGYRTKVILSYTPEEATNSLGAWFKQRVRWIKGYFHTAFIYTRHPFSLMREFGFHGMLFFIYMLILGPFLSFLVPISLVLTVMLLLGMYEFNYLQDAFLRHFTWINLIYTILHFSFCSYLASKISKHEYLKLKWPLFILYIWLIVFASFWAMIKLIKEPHKWDKTTHGVTKYKHEQT